MSGHPIENMMETTMDRIRSMVDVNTIIGNPVSTPDGTTVIPVSSVSYGFAAGGSDIPSKQTTETKNFFGGGSGAGITIKPIGFLCIQRDGQIKLIKLETADSPVEKIAEAVPSAIDKIAETFKKNKSNKKEKEIRKPVSSVADDPEI